jgi:maleylacetoacetate isomerase
MRHLPQVSGLRVQTVLLERGKVMLKLYSFYRSSASWRVRICLALKGAHYEVIPVNLREDTRHSPEYRRLNPQGFVPTLLTEDGAMSQSLPIIEYLESIYPEPPLLPLAPAARVRVRAMASLIACDIHPLNNLRVLEYLRRILGHDDAQVNAWYRHWVDEGLRALEQMAVNGAMYCFGDRVSLADVCLVPQMYNARRFGTELARFPKLRAIDSHLQSLSAFAETAPETQIDAA